MNYVMPNGLDIDAHRGDGRRFILHADEKLSAFIELERQVLMVSFTSNPFVPIHFGDAER